MATAPESEAGRRVTIDLSPSAAREVDRLTRLTGLTTADLFRSSLTLFRTYVAAAEEGRSLMFYDPRTRKTTEFQLLGLNIPQRSNAF